MAQTKRRRRRKHRGTQTGRIDRRGSRGRPRSREEARAQARRRAETRRDLPPTWNGAVMRGAFGAVLFFVLMVALFRQPVASALALSALMVVLYIPLGYYVDRFFWRRRQARKQRG